MGVFEILEGKLWPDGAPVKRSPMAEPGFRGANPVTSETVYESEGHMIRKLKDGKYRLYSRKKDPKTGKRRNLGTFSSRAAAEKHERAVQYFKHGG